MYTVFLPDGKQLVDENGLQSLVDQKIIDQDTTIKVEGLGVLKAGKIKGLRWNPMETIPPAIQTKKQQTEKSNDVNFAFETRWGQKAIELTWRNSVITAVALAVFYFCSPILIYVPIAFYFIGGVVVSSFLFGVVFFIRAVLEALSLYLGGGNGSGNRQTEDRGSRLT